MKTKLSWKKRLRNDPIQPLLEAENGAIAYFAKRDLLEQDPGDFRQIME